MAAQSGDIEFADDEADRERNENSGSASLSMWKRGKFKIGVEARMTPSTGRQDKVTNELGKTLLHRTKEKKGYGTGFAPSVSNRIMVVSKMGKKLLAQSSMEVLGASIEKDIQKISENSLQDKVTGLCLCYTEHVLFMLECESDTFSSVLQIIQKYHENGWLKKSSKVLLSSDTPVPQFSSFSYKCLTNSTTSTDFSTTDELPVVAAECIAKVTKLGDASAEAFQNNPDLTSAEGLLGFLVKQKDLETFAQHRSRQLAHSDFVLEGEVTWPAAERYYPYD